MRPDLVVFKVSSVGVALLVISLAAGAGLAALWATRRWWYSDWLGCTCCLIQADQGRRWRYCGSGIRRLAADVSRFRWWTR
jgi:hypothetical protein